MNEILNELLTEYEFVNDEINPDYVLFGPYGNNVPKPGNYIRVGYFCENMKPDMSTCDWAFGIPREEEVNNPCYKRIQWHGLNPLQLIKSDDYDVEKIYKSKDNFCNFLYFNQVPYREVFFKQLSKYKKVDAPSRSMKNMPAIDSSYKGNMWQRKRQFLSNYKFTIAFENYVYPGYQTEKLYDAMLANSLPIYCGDPNVNEIFNTNSFINTSDFVQSDNTLTNWLQKYSQPDFTDIRPQFYHNVAQRVKRKLKSTGRNLKMRLQFNNLNFSPVIDRIIELDKDPHKYIEMLKQPWFNSNKPPLNSSLKKRWAQIFQSKAPAR